MLNLLTMPTFSAIRAAEKWLRIVGNQETVLRDGTVAPFQSGTGRFDWQTGVPMSQSFRAIHASSHPFGLLPFLLSPNGDAGL
jgi:hypothetical protein